MKISWLNRVSILLGEDSGGTIAGDARKALEAKSGKPVVSKENYLPPPSTTLPLKDTVPVLPNKKKTASRQKKTKGR